MQSAELRKSKRRARMIDILKKTLSYALMSVFGVSMVLPFLWQVSTSLKEPGDVFTYPPKWVPSETKYYVQKDEKPVEIRKIKESGGYVDFRYKEPGMDEGIMTVPLSSVRKDWRLNVVWENYPKAWKAVPFARGYLNSVFIAVCVTFGQVFTSALAGYAFSRLKFPGRDKVFLCYLGTMMIPGAVTMIPVFILLRKLAWINTYKALIIPGMFTAYGTFMLRQFFMSHPSDLEDAAKIDGCNLFGIFWRIILPLSKPAIATLTIFTFMGSWGSFLWPLIVCNDMEMKPLPVMVVSFQGLYTTEWTLLMAASIIVLFPVLIVFIVGQRFFVEGIKLGAVKG